MAFTTMYVYYNSSQIPTFMEYMDEDFFAGADVKAPINGIYFFLLMLVIIMIIWAVIRRIMVPVNLFLAMGLPGATSAAPSYRTEVVSARLARTVAWKRYPRPRKGRVQNKLFTPLGDDVFTALIEHAFPVPAPIVRTAVELAGSELLIGEAAAVELEPTVAAIEPILPEPIVQESVPPSFIHIDNVRHEEELNKAQTALVVAQLALSLAQQTHARAIMEVEARISTVRGQLALEKRRTANLNVQLAEFRGKLNNMTDIVDAIVQHNSAQVGYMREYYDALEQKNAEIDRLRQEHENKLRAVREENAKSINEMEEMLNFLHEFITTEGNSGAFRKREEKKMEVMEVMEPKMKGKLKQKVEEQKREQEQRKGNKMKLVESNGTRKKNQGENPHDFSDASPPSTSPEPTSDEDPPTKPTLSPTRSKQVPPGIITVRRTLLPGVTPGNPNLHQLRAPLATDLRIPDPLVFRKARRNAVAEARRSLQEDF